jgi:hypothetical protein
LKQAGLLRFARNDVGGSRKTVEDRGKEVLPIGIERFDQLQFFLSRPGLDLLFACDRVEHFLELLVPDKHLRRVALGETGDRAVAMLRDAID